MSSSVASHTDWLNIAAESTVKWKYSVGWYEGKDYFTVENSLSAVCAGYHLFFNFREAK